VEIPKVTDPDGNEITSVLTPDAIGELPGLTPDEKEQAKKDPIIEKTKDAEGNDVFQLKPGAGGMYVVDKPKADASTGTLNPRDGSVGTLGVDTESGSLTAPVAENGSITFEYGKTYSLVFWKPGYLRRVVEIQFVNEGGVPVMKMLDGSNFVHKDLFFGDFLNAGIVNPAAITNIKGKYGLGATGMSETDWEMYNASTSSATIITPAAVTNAKAGYAKTTATAYN